MPVIPLPPDRPLPAALVQVTWRSLQVAAAVLLVVVPFGYATTANHDHVLMGAGCGVAVGVGLCLRMGEGSARSTGILVGSVLGTVMVLIGGGQDFAYGPGVYVPPMLGLGVGLLDGLGTQRVRTYREASLESLVMSVLLAVGVAPALGLVSFSFFSALAQDYTGITPVTVPARMLVGLRLVLSVGWALVVFAAVMSSIQPQLDRIARRGEKPHQD